MHGQDKGTRPGSAAADKASAGASAGVPDWVQSLVPLRRTLAVLDLEATGTAPHRDRIVEIAVLKISPGGHKDTLLRRVNPGVPIPPEATEVHGIRDADVAGEPEFRQLAPSLAEYLQGCDLAGFGIVQFDLPMLRTEFERAGVPFDITDRNIIDVKALYHFKEPRNLAAAHIFYCGEPFEAAHSAEADALATYRVLRAQLERYADLPHTFEELHRLSNPRQADFVDSEGKLLWRGGEVYFNFGKHRGVPLREVCVTDGVYVRWLVSKDFRPDFKAVLCAALDGRFPGRPAPVIVEQLAAVRPQPAPPPGEPACAAGDIGPGETPDQDHVSGPLP